ncbi:LCP family protein [Laceyella sacchari]|uniref:LCP family protein n=1 Tax=Laceyella sacchari TaxID=37482 RepID=A0ABY5U3C1_LACSH|nr:LCP family protein [Laceyella sacchari]UWE03520.1 LCP family protein [Laceyella sacchari]
MNKVDQRRALRKRRKKWFKYLTVTVILLVLGFGIYYGSLLWGALADSSNRLDTSALRDQEVKIKEDPFTVLLIGTDQRTTRPNDFRTDVLMLAAINPKTQSILLVSIPRDVYMTIPNSNGVKTRINAAPFYGRQSGVGVVENTREAVQNLLHIPVDYYAMINFQGFEDIVDSLGGIDVNVKQSFSQAMIGGGKAVFRPGMMHLNGKQALAYVRNRKDVAGGDFARNERQQEVIGLLLDKLVSFDGISQFSKITSALGNNFQHGFRLDDIPALIKVYREIPKQNIRSIHIKVVDIKVGGADMLDIPQSEKKRIRKLLQQQLEYQPKAEWLDQTDDNLASDVTN